jgi:hypothetical protein
VIQVCITDFKLFMSAYTTNFILEKTCVITGTVVAVIDSVLFISVAFTF